MNHFDEALIGKKLSTKALPANLYLASNRFKVRDGAMPSKYIVIHHDSHVEIYNEKSSSFTIHRI